MTAWSADPFDELLPGALAGAADAHFTPVHVATRAALLLTQHLPTANVLDIGAGAGKFCIHGALSVPTARFVGVELRPHLVALAHSLARQLHADNTQFICGDAFELDWCLYDAIYLFNPFGEFLHDGYQPLDDALHLTSADFFRFVELAEKRLSTLRPGMRVMTYHGFGGAMPAGFALLSSTPIGSDALELWCRV